MASLGTSRSTSWAAAGLGLSQPASIAHLLLAQFAKALPRGLEAVKLAVTTPWNNGPLEGQINRLKVIKRQMYGRAGFELLKARVLPWKPSSPVGTCTESA